MLKKRPINIEGLKLENSKTTINQDESILKQEEEKTNEAIIQIKESITEIIESNSQHNVTINEQIATEVKWINDTAQKHNETGLKLDQDETNKSNETALGFNAMVNTRATK